MHPALDAFVAAMDADCTAHCHGPTRAAKAAEHLKFLLEQPEFLQAEHRKPAPDRYAQHIVHVDPAGRYSLVALVWLPGQSTPVHDHVCWCVVGVLEGIELETPYTVVGDDLVAGIPVRNNPGSISVLVPPATNIHRVSNCSDATTISLHVYGADIEARGTSINRIYAGP